MSLCKMGVKQHLKIASVSPERPPNSNILRATVFSAFSAQAAVAARTSILKDKRYVNKADAISGRVIRSGPSGGAGSCDVLTTDTITTESAAPPTCTVDGALIFAPDTDYWLIKIYRNDELIGEYWPINIAHTIEYDASGNGNHLTLSGDISIVEVFDGTGCDQQNIVGYEQIGEEFVPYFAQAQTGEGVVV